MENTIYRAEIRLTEDLLGTVPKNKEVYAAYIATKDTEKEEVQTVEQIEERGWTGFHKDEAGYFLYDYAVKGFMCEAARTIRQFGPLKQLQDKFKRTVFVTPRRIRLPDIAPTPLERPLRAMTAQGPRVTVTRSDRIEAGAVLKFELTCLESGGIKLPCLQEVMSYGKLMGLGQWRSGSYGRFEVISIAEA